MSKNLRVWLSDDVLAQITGTGIVNGGIISIHAGGTTFDVSAGFGYIVNNYTDPYTPTVNYVIWNSFSSQPDNFLATAGVTNIAIDINGNIVQQAEEFSLELSRELIILGKTIHASRTTITNVSTNAKFINNLPEDSYDLARSLGVINVYGNIYGPNGPNSYLNKSAGRLHRVGINYGASRENPNTYDIGQQIQLSFRYRYQDGSGNFFDTAPTQSVDPYHYDDGSGTLVLVPTNKFTIQRIFLFKDFTIITYGQTLYNTIQDAQDGILTEMPVLDSNLEDAVLRCFLVLKQGVTSLQDENVYFSQASKLGESLVSMGYSGYSGYSGISGYSGYSGLGMSGYSGYSGIGTSGYSGYSGISGYYGYSGYSGISGYSGYSGISGYSGYSGYSGIGASGYSGYSGIQGYSGYSGTSGASGFVPGGSGYSGASGYSGFSGYSGYSGIGTSGYSGQQGSSGYSGISGATGGSEVRLIVNGDSTVQLLCAGPTSDLNNVILSKAVSPLAPSVTITKPSTNVKYISLKAFWSASDWGTYTSTTITFPETTGQTTLDTTQRPLALRYTSSSYANGAPNSTVTNTAGTVVITMAGFTGGQSNALQLIW